MTDNNTYKFLKQPCWLKRSKSNWKTEDDQHDK